MKNTYLLDIVRVMTTQERTEFMAFCSCQGPKKGETDNEATSLFRCLMEAVEGSTEQPPLKKDIFSKVFPGKPLIPGKLEKLMTELTKQLRNFLLKKRLVDQETEMVQQVKWLTWLRERRLANRHHQLLTKLKAENSTSFKESLHSLFLLFQIAEEEHNMISEQNTLTDDLNIPDTIHRLDIYYNYYRTELLNRYTLQGFVTNLPDQEEIEAFNNVPYQVPSALQTDSPLLEITWVINSLLKNNTFTHEDFLDLMDRIKEVEHNFTEGARTNLYTYLRNYCTLLYSRGHQNLAHSLHHLHKANLENGTLLYYGHITGTAYVNVAIIGLQVGQHEWVHQFLEEYKNLIWSGDKDLFYYNLALATYYFSVGHFEKALDHLPDVSENPYTQLIVKRLEIKIYYELKSDLLSYKLEAFRKYIQRTATKTFSAHLRSLNLGFANMLLQLIQSPVNDARRSEQLIKRIEAKPFIAERFWLMEKARELG